VQQACNDALFVKLRIAREIDRVDTAERMIRRVPDQLVDRIGHFRVSGLSQRGEESLGLAHTLDIVCGRASEKADPCLGRLRHAARSGWNHVHR
jgi:hypothetical protein